MSLNGASAAFATPFIVRTSILPTSQTCHNNRTLSSPLPKATTTPPPSARPPNPRPSIPPIKAKSGNGPQFPSNAIPYFAYFSNMNPRKIGPTSTQPARRFNILRTDIAILPSHRLDFTALGFPPEPAFANLTPTPNSNVHGILHWVRPTDFDRLSLSEGVLPSFLPFQQLARPFASTIETVDVLVDGVSVRASTFVFPARAPTFLKPSRRYVNVAIDGARYWGLDRAYIDNVLSKIEFSTGPLGGFGLAIEPRPHVLDRPNPTEKFGDPLTDIYSPYVHIRAEEAVDAFSKNDKDLSGSSLRLFPLTKLDAAKKPLYFLPGIDGEGKSIISQVYDIEREGVYNLSTVSYPSSNRDSLETMVDDIIAMVWKDAAGRPISIFAESMGGALSLFLALENLRRKERGDEKTLDIELLLMLNPATSYKRSDPKAVWEYFLGLNLPDDVFKALLPPILMPFFVDFSSVVQSSDVEYWPRLTKMLGAVRGVGDVLPQGTVEHRLSLLANLTISDHDLSLLAGAHGPKHIALISAMNDNMLPSYSESFRLRRAIPGIYSTVLHYGGHGPMFDRRFSLASFLGLFAYERKVKSINLEISPSASVLRRRSALRKKFGTHDSNNHARITQEKLRELRNFLAPSLRDSSPVFIGEENVPAYDPDKPVLFVGNHTLLGWLDGALPILRMLETRNVLICAMAHPILFQPGMANFPGTGLSKITVEQLKDFGLDAVSPQLLIEQLSQGNWTLLFPGGAAEALKQPTDKKYCTKWPLEPEFVRPCALFGATVVPVSTVGSEDMVRLVGGSDVTEKIVKTGKEVFGIEIDTSFAIDNAKEWKNGGPGQTMLPPLMLPARADRLYFRFGKAFEIDEACLADERLEKQVYENIRKEVDAGVEMLLRRREKDEFRSLDSRKQFAENFGQDVTPPAGPGWTWMTGSRVDSYLDDDLQPPL